MARIVLPHLLIPSSSIHNTPLLSYLISARNNTLSTKISNCLLSPNNPPHHCPCMSPHYSLYTLSLYLINLMVTTSVINEICELVENPHDPRQN